MISLLFFLFLKQYVCVYSLLPVSPCYAQKSMALGLLLWVLLQVKNKISLGDRISYISFSGVNFVPRRLIQTLIFLAYLHDVIEYRMSF